jgi:hypothetical protein
MSLLFLTPWRFGGHAGGLPFSRAGALEQGHLRAPKPLTGGMPLKMIRIAAAGLLLLTGSAVAHPMADGGRHWHSSSAADGERSAAAQRRQTMMLYLKLQRQWRSAAR